MDSELEVREKSLTTLLRDLAGQVSELVRHEIHLARAEMTEKVQQAGNGVGYLAFALILGIAALTILLQAAAAGLAEVLEPWLAALIVGGLAALVAFALASKGRSNLKARNLRPDRTIESVRDDARFAKEKVK